MFRSSRPEVFLKKDALQTRSKPTAEQRRRSATPTKSLYNFIEITANPENTLFQMNISGGLFLYAKRVLKEINYKKLLFKLLKELY